ncbi:MAG: chromate resistance protein ChrB domain-containing protein [Pseudomonadota bacterium]
MTLEKIASVSASTLRTLVRGESPPIIIDVRRGETFRAAPELIRGALRRDPLRVADWAKTLPAASDVVVYCVHGHEVSQGAAKALKTQGISASYLEGGIEAWKAQKHELAGKPTNASTRWVTRERPKVDRIACPWLIRRFIDPEAEFLYVPPKEVLRAAAERDAVPYDIPDVEFSHDGDLCSFDAFLKFFRLKDPALEELAVIVRGADTNRPDLAPQCAGLAAFSIGLSLTHKDDHEMLAQGMVMYDALYTWCKKGKQEVHTWNPDLYR